MYTCLEEDDVLIKTSEFYKTLHCAFKHRFVQGTTTQKHLLDYSIVEKQTIVILNTFQEYFTVAH